MPEVLTKQLVEELTPASDEGRERPAFAARVTSVGLWDWDLRTDEVFFSREWKRQLGFEDSEIPNALSELESRIHPDDAERVLAELRSYIAQPAPAYTSEFRLRNKQGEYREMLAHGTVVRAKDGKSIRFLGSHSDITRESSFEEAQREQAERTTRQNEELLRTIIEDQTEMIARWKPDGSCTFANRAFCQAMGRESCELVGAACVPALSEEGMESMRNRMGLLSPKHPVSTYIHESMSSSGKMFAEEWTDRGIFDAGGTLLEVQSTGRDITERRRAELRIQQLNRVYALLSNVNETILREGDPQLIFRAACRIAFEKGGFLMAWIGLKEAGKGALRLVANAGASPDTLDILEYIYGDPEGGCAFTSRALRTGEHAVCNDIAKDPAAAHWRSLALQRGYRAMTSLPLKVGDEVAGTFNLYAGEADFFDDDELRLLDELALDIGYAMQVHRRETDRQRAESAREESEEKFRQLTETIQDVFWMRDVAENKLLYVSPAYAGIWGRSCDSLYASPDSWVECVHPEDRDRVLKSANTETLLGGFDEEYRIIRPDGEVRWIRDRAFPISDASGHVHRVAGVARDVTEHRALQDQLRQSQKMDAIGQLAGGVAHDFNNILAAIIMQTELVLMNSHTPDAVRKDLQEVCTAAERAAALTRQLLLFSRRQVLQARNLDLNVLVTDLAKMLQRIIGTDVRLQLHLHSSPVITRADAGMLDQVILNLAVNARDAMPQGGRLLIETAVKSVDESIARIHPDAVAGKYVWLSVTDTGGGIAPEILPRIFEPFFTTKEPGKGTGLGMATVYGIVRQHRGWLHVHSEMGQGTNVQVFLPAADVEPADIVREASIANPPRGTETILLAEDEEVVRVLLRAVLERYGYTVIEAFNGDEALRLWQGQHAHVHLLLTDLVMPGELSGKQLAKQLRAENPQMKVIFVSGYSAEIAGRELELRTGENFLQKPFSPNQLLVAVRNCLDCE